MSNTTPKGGVPPFVNRMMKFILRSPVHGMVSKTVLLITFTGRKSGKIYTTPVSYSQSGDHVTIFTHANWWKNLHSNTPVTLHIRGQQRQGLPETVAANQQAASAPLQTRHGASVAAELAAHLRQVPSDAKYYGVTFDNQGNPGTEEIERAVQTVVMIRVRLC